MSINRCLKSKMNEILIRTHKGEYCTGEDIYGAVYVNICHPTSGRGVRLKFKGYEHYEIVEQEQNSNRRETSFGKKEYINCSDINLFVSDVPLMLGKYSFPFKLSLLSDIPGTFSAKGNNPVPWETKVEYWIEAEMIDASTLKNSQTVIVQKFKPIELNITDKPQAVTTSQEIGFFRKRKVHVTARLQNSHYRTGEMIRLKVIITNEPKESRVDFKQISIKLLRYLLLTSGKGESLEIDQTPTVIREMVIQDINPEILNSGLDNVYVPAKNKDGLKIWPSVDGKFIQCQYDIEITATLANGVALPLNLPVHSIFPEENNEWKSWNPPEWVSHCDAKLSDNQFSVPNYIVSGEAFAGMPGFQALPD